MLKSRLELFIAKRILITYIIFSVLIVIFMDHKWLVFIGLTLGTVFALLRLNSLVFTFSKLMPENEGDFSVRKSVLRYVFNQIMAIVLLAAALKYSLWLFAGMAAGMLQVALIIMVNGITEALGITHNNYE